MEQKQQVAELTRKAWEIRLTLLRMFSYGKAHHFGGSFSCADILTVLYFHHMNYFPDRLDAPERDRFIMSKGHSVPTQYAVLGTLGVFSGEELSSIKRLGSVLQGHPDIRKTRGIEAPTGSLGQGLSFANGVALAARARHQDFRIYVMMGDGELQEGQVWEAAMTTSHFGLGRLTAIVDANRYQSQGSVEEIKNIEPLEDKFRSFGWHVIRIDGHDISAIMAALEESDRNSDQPSVIIADTVKGKGISFIEGTYKYHNYSLSEEEYHRAEQEILNHLSDLDKGAVRK